MDTIELIVQQLLIKQRVRLKTLEESIISLATSSSTTTMTSTTTTTTLSNHFKNQQSNNDLIRQQQQIKTHQIFTSLSSGQIMDAQTLSKKSSSTLKPDISSITTNNDNIIDLNNGNSQNIILQQNCLKQMDNNNHQNQSQNSLTVCYVFF